MSKMYIVVRNDLSPGAQIAQSVHAATQFFIEHYNVATHWFYKSNTIVCLSVNGEKDLIDLANNAKQWGIKYSFFLEPDFNNQLTALALEPGEKSSMVCKDLPLALKVL